MRGARRLHTPSVCSAALLQSATVPWRDIRCSGQEVEEHLMGVSDNSTSLTPLGMQKQSARGLQHRRWSLIFHLLHLGTMS